MRTSSHTATPALAIARHKPAPQPATADADSPPAVRLLADTLLEAARLNASDLHIEPMEHGWRMRLRVDGVLHELARPRICATRSLRA